MCVECSQCCEIETSIKTMLALNIWSLYTENPLKAADRTSSDDPVGGG